VSAVRVTVVRPKRGLGESLQMLVTAIVATLINAWIVMTLAPVVADMHPSYWQSVAAMVLISTLLPSNGYLLWTKDAK